MSEPEFDELFEALVERFPEERGGIVTIAEMLMDRGMKRGIERGVEQGRLQERCALVKAMHLKGQKIHDIVSLTGLHEDEVVNLIERS